MNPQDTEILLDLGTTYRALEIKGYQHARIRQLELYQQVLDRTPKDSDHHERAKKRINAIKKRWSER